MFPGVKGDLVVQLAPEPLPASSTGSQDQELDVTLDEVTTPGTIGTSHDAKVDTEQTEMKTSAQSKGTHWANIKDFMHELQSEW